MKKLTVFIVMTCGAATLGLSGCATPTEGALTGAGAGAVIGGIAGGGRGAAIGAGAGALTGAAIGEQNRRHHGGQWRPR